MPLQRFLAWRRSRSQHRASLCRPWLIKESPRSTEIEDAKYRRLIAGAYESRSLQKTRPRMRRYYRNSVVGDLSHQTHLTGACGTHNCGCNRTNATAGPPLAPRLPPQGICQSACVHQTASSELSFLIPFAQLQPAPLILFEPLGSSHVYVVNPLLHIVE